MRQFIAAAGVLIVLSVPAQAAWPFGRDEKSPSKYVKATNVPPAKAVPVAPAPAAKSAAKPVAKPATAAPASGDPVPLTAEAAPAATGRVSRLTFVDPEREQRFLTLLSGRRMSKQAIVVLSRLTEEKKFEVTQFEDQLQVDYGVDPAGIYEYDAVSNIMYQIIQPAGTGTAVAINAPQLERKRLWNVDDPKKEQALVRLAASKQLSRRQLAMLEVMLQEKVGELRSFEQMLLKEYEIDPQKNYEYDAARKTVYEIIAPAGSATRPAKP